MKYIFLGALLTIIWFANFFWWGSAFNVAYPEELIRWLVALLLSTAFSLGLLGLVLVSYSKKNSSLNSDSNSNSDDFEFED